MKKSLHEYRALLKAVRNICSLPTRASATYIFARKYAGGLAFQDPTVESDLQAIVQALRILSSPDTAVSNIEKAELKAFVRRTAQSAPTAELITKYLSATQDPRLDRFSYSTHSSLWTWVHQHILVLYFLKRICRMQLSLRTFLHRLVQQRSADDLMSLKDQGKVARCMAADQYGNGSSWHMNGLNIHFIIHRARLNVLPLNANKSRFSYADPTCRHCCYPETLPHVICHCRPQMTRIRDRHNKIVRFGEITTDRAIR